MKVKINGYEIEGELTDLKELISQEKEIQAVKKDLVITKDGTKVSMILEFLKDNPNSTAQEAFEKLPMSKRTAGGTLSYLSKKGILKETKELGQLTKYSIEKNIQKHRSKRKIWTNEETQRLKELIHDGVRNQEIARIMKRTKGSVATKKKELKRKLKTEPIESKYPKVSYFEQELRKAQEEAKEHNARITNQ